jgi:hypothetical protein
MAVARHLIPSRAALWQLAEKGTVMAKVYALFLRVAVL